MLGTGHIPRDHCANLHFDADEAWIIRNMACISSTHGAFGQHDIFESFRNSPKSFRNVMRRLGSALAMGYFKTREMGFCERGYIIMENVDDLLKKIIIWDVT